MRRKSSACVIVACLFLLSAPAAKSFGATSVRFVAAAPDVGSAELTVSVGGTDRRVGGRTDFGQVTDYIPLKTGAAKLEAKGTGGRRLARAATQLERGGHYTAVLLARDSGATLHVYRDERAQGGRAKLRAVQAAPELGKVGLRLDGEAIGEDLAYRATTDYRAVEPGKYDLEVRRAGGGGAALASKAGVRLTAGTASTAFVMGSRGKKVRVVVATDSSAAPGQAPETGLGGLADGGPSWLLVAMAALLAGSAGGALYLRAGGARRG
jgi:hypothetical protein